MILTRKTFSKNDANVYEGRTVIECPECAFEFSVIHELSNKPGEYTCPNCEESRLIDENKRLREALEGLQRFKDYFNELYGQNLEVANWHLNGELEHFDDFYESACMLIEGEQHESSTCG